MESVESIVKQIVDVDAYSGFASVRCEDSRYLLDCGRVDENQRLRTFVRHLHREFAAALTAERANVTREQTDRFLRLVTEVCPNPNCAGEFSSDDGLRQWLRASMSYFGREAPEGCHAPKGHVLDDCGTVRKEADIAAERAKFAAFAGPDGEPRKVLGALPVTADGYIVGMNGEEIGTTVFIPRTWNDGTRSVIAKKFCAYLPSTDPLSSFYSTKQAAEAAKEKQ